jgi:hypothetical protein
MRTFKKPNLSDNWKCPICNTNELKEVVLIGIAGTESGNNIQAEQIHLDCIELTYDKTYNMLYQKL